MNPHDVLKYGHLTVLGSVDGLSESKWDEGGVCGYWSVKNIIAHLASYELLLAGVLRAVSEGGQSPYLERYLAAGPSFNDTEVDARKEQSVEDTLAEYGDAYDAVVAVAPDISAESWTTTGVLPWYGDQYSLEDWIVYQFYGHKREHCAQIAVYRDRLGG